MDAMILVMYVCLAKQIGTDKCFNDELGLTEKHIVISEENVSPMQCLMTALPQMAKWNDEHPQYTIRRWKCVPRSRLPQGT